LLNAREKWNETRSDLKIGDFVHSISPESPRAHWTSAKVPEFLPGQDGHVRVVKLQVGMDYRKTDFKMHSTGVHLRTVPPFVTAHTFYASRDIRVS